MAHEKALIQVDSLSKVYDAITAVDSISFTIYTGEIFGLLGPNGAGKTTAISILAGILSQTGGKVTMNGKPFQNSPEERSQIGFVPQDLAIYNKLTGRENLHFFGSLYGLQSRKLTDKTRDMLELVGLSEHADRRTETYSGGMKRRLNLASGLMHEPKLLLLDEPTVGVDPQSRNHIFEGVRALNKEGLTVLYTSHYMEEVQTLCHRVGIMDRGRLIAYDSVEALISLHGTASVLLTLGVSFLSADILEEIESEETVRGKVQIESGNELNQCRIVVSADRPDRAIPPLVNLLNSHHTPLLSLEIKQPTLEDVFLSLTGKHLRD